MIDDLTEEQIDTLGKYSKLAVVAVVVILGGGIFYHFVEKLSWLDAYYFTFVTLATVGYGDIVPTTPEGKLFTMFYMFVGITLFVVLAKVVLGHAAIRERKRKAARVARRQAKKS